MIESRERDAIRTWNDDLPGDVSLTVVLTADPRSERFEAFGMELGAVAPRVRVAVEREDTVEAPAIVVGGGLTYLAIPAGTALAPFLEGAMRFGITAGPAARADGKAAAGDANPAVRAYVSAHCPHCPVATRTLFGLLERGGPARLTIVDAELFPEMAAGDGVKSVPTVIAGMRYRSSGTVSVDEIRAALGGSRPDAGMLGRLLDGGDAGVVAEMMAAAGEVFPAVLDRIAHDTMTFRLGAMAALERLIETAPDVARTAEAGLWDRIAGAGREATGDLLYMLGETGTAATAPWLEAFYEATSDDELREAVTDALARIAERHDTPAP